MDPTPIPHRRLASDSTSDISSEDIWMGKQAPLLGDGSSRSLQLSGEGGIDRPQVKPILQWLCPPESTQLDQNWLLETVVASLRRDIWRCFAITVCCIISWSCAIFFMYEALSLKGVQAYIDALNTVNVVFGVIVFGGMYTCACMIILIPARSIVSYIIYRVPLILANYMVFPLVDTISGMVCGDEGGVCANVAPSFRGIFFGGLIPILIAAVSLRCVCSLQVLRKRKRTVSLVLLGVVLVVGLLLLWRYANRRERYNAGIFGSLDHSLSECHLSDDRMLVSHLIPRGLFLFAIGEYFCMRKRTFVTKSDEDDGISTTSQLLIDCPLTTYVFLIPRVGLYSAEELKRYYPTIPHSSFLMESVMERMEAVVIEGKATPKSFSYNHTVFESVLVRCGSDSSSDANVFTNVQRRDDVRPARKATVETPNVLILLIDSESRNDFENDFPKTIALMRSQKKRGVDIHEFFQHIAAGKNTWPQTLRLFAGVKVQNTSDPLWIPAAEQSGYVTSWSTDDCATWDTIFNNRLSPPHYTLFEPFCFSEYLVPHPRYFTLEKGPYSSSRRCLFQRYAGQYLFDYVQQLWSVYPDEAKFVISHWMYAHEATGEVVTFLDPMLSSHLRAMEVGGDLDNTIVIMMSDHGNRMSLLPQVSGDGPIEAARPFLYIYTPKGLLTDKQQSLMDVNRHRLVSVLDIHRMMADVMELEEPQNSEGVNFFREEIPRDRNCEIAEELQEECNEAGWLICEERSEGH